MIEKVIGFVDGQPVYYTETEPTNYETTADVEEKTTHELEITAIDDHNNTTTIRQTAYMSGWIEPIVDRIAQDIRDGNERAYLNYFDLNRIEQDTEFLSDLLDGYGYSQNLTHKTDWLMSDFPYASQMERVRANIQKLIYAYHSQDVPLPATMQNLDWMKLNALENNLKLMKEMIHRMEQSFRYCGTFYSGQEVSF